MHARTNGSARVIAFAGAGLLSLVVVVAIMVTMGGEEAKQAGQSKKQMTQDIQNIQNRINPVGVTASDPADPAAAPGDYEVRLEDVGMDKASVVELVAKLIGQTPAQAQSLVATLPVTVKTDLTEERANDIARQLSLAGASAVARRKGP